jgi:hypothetical protein
MVSASAVICLLFKLPHLLFPAIKLFWGLTFYLQAFGGNDTIIYIHNQTLYQRR